jgi:hypothetical protein
MKNELQTLLREELDRFRAEILAELRSSSLSFDPEQMMDNHDFLRVMKVSIRTAQLWRSTGLIPYAQIGRKVYYKLTDVSAFIEQHHRKAYSDFRKFQEQRPS